MSNFFLVCFYTIDGQEYILVRVYCHTNNAECSTSGFVIIFSVYGTVNVMCLFIPAAACLTILYSLETIIIAQCAQ